MNDCIFCKIIEGDIPAFKIYEDNHVCAFLDITTSTKGHTLVIPKKHVKDIFEMDEELASNFFKAIPKIAKALNKTFNPIGLNIINNNREPYQSVFHYHMHLIPRYKGDGFAITFGATNPSMDELKAISEEIKKNM